MISMTRGEMQSAIPRRRSTSAGITASSLNTGITMLSSGLAMLVNDFLIPWLQFRWVHLSLPLRMGFISPTPKSRRYSCYHCEGGHVLGYDSTSSYHTTLAHGHA